MRLFLIDGNEVGIPEENIKQYYNIGQCFKYIENELVPIEGNIYIDMQGNICDCENCSNEIEQLLDQDGLPLNANLDFSTMDPIYGFIYNNKLQIVDRLEKADF